MHRAVEKISYAEAKIMKIVWSNESPVTYAYIRTTLTPQDGGGWESPTINTLVNRLVKKGVLIQEKRKVFYYSAAVTEEEYLEAKTKDFIRKVYGGNAKNLLSALVTYKEVYQEDLDQLKECLRKGGGLD